MIKKQQPSMRGKMGLSASMHGAPKVSPMAPIRVPDASMASEKPIPTAPAQKPFFFRSRNQVENIVVKLTNRILETEDELNAAGISTVQAIDLAFVYRDLMPGDEISPISIIMVRDFLESVKANNENGYNKLMVYYNVMAEERPERKIEKLRNAAHFVLSQYRTIEYAYQYSHSFREVADKMAAKLDAPESMGIVERVKWLRIWSIILCDQMLFWGDLNESGKLMSAENTRRFNELHIYPETMLLIWHQYLKNLPDRAVIYDMILGMLSVFPESARNAVLQFGEITTNTQGSTKVEHIRNTVKKLFFPRPWLVQSSHFCVTWGLQSFPAKRLASAVMAWKNGGIENLPTFELPFYDVYNNCKLRTVTCYQYDTAVVNGKEVNAGVTCKEEMEMYVVLYKWLLAHPDFKFGPEQKTLKEYGIESLLEEKVDLRTAVSMWITSMGLAGSEDDINWELAETVLNLSENASWFEDFYRENISAQEIYQKYHFASDAQATACLSKTSKPSALEINKMGSALKRVKMFGIERALPGDIIYLELFRYLAFNKPDVVGKSLIQLYSAKFCA